MKTISERRQINGEWIRAFRKGLGLNQEELAQRLGISRPTVARWELDTFRPSQLAARVLLEFVAQSRKSQAALSVKKAVPLTRLKVRNPQRSPRSSHDPDQRVPHPGSSKRKPH
jgi:DNA-binding transcriptional regulator YiaG